MRTINKVLSVIVMVAIAIAFVPMVNGQVFAAAKKPAAPTITSAKETTDETDEYKAVVVTWKKAKNAKKYEVAIRSAEKTWVKFKTVKKTAKNKKKYTKKNKYKVVAKGKKYIVYKYEYKYSNKDYTTSCSYRFVDGPDWDDLHPSTTYTFAVRSVNGKKYSAWKTATVTTSASSWLSETLTTPGDKLKVAINGKDYTLTVGSKFTAPIPQPQTCTVEAKPFSFKPTKIEYYLDRTDGIYLETVSVTGKTPDNFDASWGVYLIDGACQSLSYSLKQPSFSRDGKYTMEGLGYGPGYIGKKVYVEDPAVTIVWTLDGTEPKLGQESLWMNGSDYPFGQVRVGRTPYDGEFMVHDTVSYNEGYSYIWGSDLSYAMFKKSEWIKVYEDGALVEESFYYDDADYSDFYND